MKATELIDCEQVARELATQPELLPAVRGRLTGKRAASDEERNLFAAALRMIGQSDREIAAAVGCARESIPFLLAEAERSARVRPVKERLARLAESLAERSGIALHRLLNRVEDGVETVDLAAMLKATGTVYGIATDKSQLLTGAPTEILELRVGAGRAEIEQFCRQNSLPIEATVTAIDSASATKPTECSGDCSTRGYGHQADTESAAGGDLAERAADGGGGGRRSVAG